jgi:hypothetical protein
MWTITTVVAAFTLGLVATSLLLGVGTVGVPAVFLAIVSNVSVAADG